MFRTDNEKKIAQLRWVDGRSIRQIAAETNESKSAVHRHLKVLTTCLRQLKVNTSNPESVRDYVADMLRHCRSLAA